MAFNLLQGFLPCLHPPTAAEPELCGHFGQENSPGMCPHGRLGDWSEIGRTAPAGPATSRCHPPPSPRAPRGLPGPASPAPSLGTKSHPWVAVVPSPWQPLGDSAGTRDGCSAQPSPKVPVLVLKERELFLLRFLFARRTASQTF